MCRYGDTVPVEVAAPGGERKMKHIDACLADIVRALDTAGIAMHHSCCGHGKGSGDILLEDGRTLIVRNAKWRQKPVSECTQREGHRCRALLGVHGGFLRCQRMSALGYGQHGCAIERAILDSQVAGKRLAALVEGLRELEGRLHDCRDADRLSDLLLAHGFAADAEVPREAAQEAVSGVDSPEAGKGA